MNLVYDALMTALGHPRRSPSGWHSFNAICCPHQGAHRPDTKKRGGLKLDGPTVIYHCHNCSFRTGWSEGSFLGSKVKDLLSWAGLSSDQLRDLEFRAGLTRYQAQNGVRVTLPEGLKSVQDWIDEDCADLRLVEIAQFLLDFEPPRDLKDAYWTPDDNDMGLSNYIILIKGDLSWPTGWVGWPYLDNRFPGRTHLGVDDEDCDIPPETLAKMERLMREHPDGTDAI